MKEGGREGGRERGKGRIEGGVRAKRSTELHTCNEIIFFSIDTGERERKELPSRASNLGPVTGSPVHEAPGQYSGQKFVFLTKFVFPFFLFHICQQIKIISYHHHVD